MTNQRGPEGPLSDVVVIALAGMFLGEREPSHSAIGFQIKRAGLGHADPANDSTIGKEKRVRQVLTWALENDIEKGGRLVALLVGALRASGGFRPESTNYIGVQDITNAAEAFLAEGFELASNGELRPIVLDNLSGADLTAALRANVRRARQGALDAALLAGSGKDLLEATAAHVVVERYGAYNDQTNFPTLLGQAFVAVGLTTSSHARREGETPQERLQRALFDAACAVNTLRNKQGTGHGRPFLPTLTENEAKIAVETMGLVCQMLLDGLRE